MRWKNDRKYKLVSWSHEKNKGNDSGEPEDG